MSQDKKKRKRKKEASKTSNRKSKNWDKIFVGRKKIIEQILTTSGDIFIFGARRIGKTSLLKFVEKKFGKNKIPAFYFSIQGYRDSQKVYRKIKNSFNRKRFKIPELESGNLTLFDFFDKLDLKLNQKIVFLVDEVEQITEIEKNEPGFIDKLRNSIETTENIQFILTASPYFKMLVANSICSAFITAFEEFILLPVMEDDEIFELSKKLIPSITNAEIKQILEFTHFQPYLVKIFLNQLTQNGEFRAASKSIAQDTYNANSLDGIFPNYFNGLKKEDQEIIRKIHRNKFRFKKQYETKLKEIVQYGYLKYEEGNYKISNWFFEQWLNEVEFEDRLLSDDKTITKSIFNKLTDYFKKLPDSLQGTILKYVILIVVLIIASLLAFLLGKDLKFIKSIVELFK